jgi:hypothetical protein
MPEESEILRSAVSEQVRDFHAKRVIFIAHREFSGLLKPI